MTTTLSEILYEDRYILGEMMYIVLTGDIRGSSKVDDRRELADRLVDLCAHLNQHFVSNIAVKFKVVSGDGIQGLLTLDTNIFKLAYYIRAVIFPYYMRLGFGVGGIDTAFDEDISQVDGVCFQSSAKAIDWAKSNNHWVRVESNDFDIDTIWNGLFISQELIMNKLKNNQNKAINLYVKKWVEDSKYPSLVQISHEMKSAPPNVHRIFMNTGWYELKYVIGLMPNIKTILSK